MPAPAAVLTVIVDAATTKASSDLTRFEGRLRATSATAGRTTKTTDRLASGLSKVGRVAKYAAAAGVAAFLYEAKKSVETTQELTLTTAGLHRNLGIATKRASEWASVARSRGIDTRSLNMSFKTLSTQLYNAKRGSDTAKQAFADVGITQKDLNNVGDDTNKMLLLLADRLGSAEGGMKRQQAAGKLLGRGYQTLLPLFADGAKGLKEQLHWADEYGSVLDNKTVKSQMALVMAQRESKAAWQGLQVQFATGLTPVLMDAEKQFQRIAKIIGDPHLTQDEKFTKVSTIIEKDFDTALNFFTDKVLPTMISTAGHAAPKIAKAIVEGFLNADTWGKLLIGTWLISKMGGWGAVTALGTKFGTRFGTSAATAESGALATGSTGGVVAGGQMAAKTSRFTRVGGAVGPIVAIPGVLALLKRLKETQDTVSDSSASLGDKVKSVYTTAFPILGSELTVADKALSVFDAGTVHATGHIADLKHGAFTLDSSIAQLAGHINDGGKDLRTLRRNFGDLTTRSAQQAIDGLKDKYGSLVTAGHNMSQRERQAWKDVAQAAHDNGELSQKELTKLTGAFTHNSQKWRDQMQRAAQVTGQTTKSIADSVGNASVHVSKTYDGMVKVVGGGLNWLTSNTSKAAQALGSTKEVKFHTSPAATGPGHFGHRMKRGGDVPGIGNNDSIPAMLTPGEFVVRREQAAKHRGLLEAINFQKYAVGGLVGTQPATQALGSEFVKKFGGAISSGLRPGDPGFHGRGEAFDWVGGNWDAATRFANQIGPQLLEGIHQGPPGSNVSWDSGHQVSPSFWGSATWAEHISHVHIAIAKMLGALGKFGAPAPELQRLMLRGPQGGLRLRDTGQGGLDMVWKAGKRHLAKLAAATGGIASVPTGPIQQMARQMVTQTWGGGQWSPFSALEMSEAGWNPRAVNPSSGAAGLAQALPPSKYPAGAWPYQGLSSAKLQLQWMMGYIKDRYGTPGGAWAFHQAHNWYGNGADFIARKPQLIGVGDGGPERVRVTPAHGGGGGAPSVTVINEFHSGMEWLEDLIDHRIEISDGEDRTHAETMAAMGG